MNVHMFMCMYVYVIEELHEYPTDATDAVRNRNQASSEAYPPNPSYYPSPYYDPQYGYPYQYNTYQTHPHAYAQNESENVCVLCYVMYVCLYVCMYACLYVCLSVVCIHAPTSTSAAAEALSNV